MFPSFFVFPQQNFRLGFLSNILLSFMFFNLKMSQSFLKASYMFLYINLKHSPGVFEYSLIPVGYIIRIHRQGLKLSKISEKYLIIIFIAITRIIGLWRFQGFYLTSWLVNIYKVLILATLFSLYGYTHVFLCVFMYTYVHVHIKRVKWLKTEAWSLTYMKRIHVSFLANKCLRKLKLFQRD